MLLAAGVRNAKMHASVSRFYRWRLKDQEYNYAKHENECFVGDDAVSPRF